MFKKFILAAMVLGFVSTASAADVFIGAWKLNVAKSKYSPGPAPKAVTVTIAEKGTDLSVAAIGTDGMDKPISVKYTYPAKGGKLNYSEGAPANGATVTLKRSAPNTIEGVATLNGKETGTTKTVVAADGKSFTRTVKTTNAEGKPVDNTEVYDKQ